MNVIVLNRRSHDESQLESIRAAVAKSFQEVDPAAAARTGSEDFKQRFQRSGGWKAWQQTVARVYDVFVLPDLDIGRATYDILKEVARYPEKKVVYTTDGLLFRRVKGVTKNEGDSWVDYARVEVE